MHFRQAKSIKYMAYASVSVESGARRKQFKYSAEPVRASSFAASRMQEVWLTHLRRRSAVNQGASQQ
jgi:hypothetical protein